MAVSVAVHSDGDSETMRRENSSSKDIQLPMPSTEVQQPSVVILGFDFSRKTAVVQLLVCSTGVFVFYLVYGYLQELLFKLPGFRPFGWYLTLVQFAFYSIYSLIERTIQGKGERKIPLGTYAQLALYTVATMGLSNSSVGYLNYPTQVIFKCCKLIPVLIGGILIQGKRYGLIDLLAAVCMSVGLILFSLADNQVSPNFNAKGYVMISMALVADAIIGNVQEKAMKEHKAANTEVVLYSYSLGCLYIFIGTVLSGEFVEATKFFLEHPVETYGYALVFATAGYFGVNIVLTLVKRFGALIAVTVTTCRKAVTIILSFFFFAKPFTSQYVWSGCIVLFGIYLNVYSKNRQSWNKSLLSWLHALITFCQKRRITGTQPPFVETV